MNYLIFKDFFIILLNFYEFFQIFLNLFLLKNIKKLVLMRENLAADVEGTWCVAMWSWVHVPCGAHICRETHVRARVCACVISEISILFKI